MRYYLDAAPIIYLIENVQPYSLSVEARLSAVGVTLVTSEPTRLECRVMPLRQGNAGLLADFDAWFTSSITEFVPLTRDVIDRATEIRAQFNFKPPDALHLAAAITTNCDVFLTNDQQLSRFPNLIIETI